MFGIKTRLLKRKYRKQNCHNFTTIKNACDINKISVGKGTYGIIDIKTYGGQNCNLLIGNYCSIANDTVFLLGGEHCYDKISTYPFKSKYLKEPESLNKGDIIIKDDVWIGYGSTILSGVTIGQGAIIGAKSTVAKDIPPYAIFAGNKVIKYRFNENIIKELLKINFSKIDEEFIRKNINLLYEKINENNIKEIMTGFEKKE